MARLKRGEFMSEVATCQAHLSEGKDSCAIISIYHFKYTASDPVYFIRHYILPAILGDSLGK